MGKPVSLIRKEITRVTVCQFDLEQVSSSCIWCSDVKSHNATYSKLSSRANAAIEYAKKL